MEKLKALREARGWSIYEVARRTKVSYQSIANLEGSESSTRPGDPPKTTVATASSLLELFYPELRLCDFVPGSLLEAKPRRRSCHRRILERQSKQGE